MRAGGKKVSLTTQVFLAMILGSIAGLVDGQTMVQLGFLGDIWLNCIKMIVVPMVLCTIVTGIISQDSLASLRRVSVRVITYYVVTTVLACIIGIVVAMLLQPGKFADFAGLATQEIKGGVDITELSQRRFLKMVDFFYDNWDAMKLIVCCSKGSSYERIFDKAIDLIDRETLRWLKQDGVKMSRRIRFFIHVMVTSHCENLKEIFYHNLKKSEAVEYVLDFNVYHCAGWKQYWMEQVKG